MNTVPLESKDSFDDTPNPRLIGQLTTDEFKDLISRTIQRRSSLQAEGDDSLPGKVKHLKISTTQTRTKPLRRGNSVTLSPVTNLPSNVTRKKSFSFDDPDAKSSHNNTSPRKRTPQHRSSAESLSEAVKSRAKSKSFVSKKPYKNIHSSAYATSDYLSYKYVLDRKLDPHKWIIAAGMLKKKRDGKLRDGWAQRFFVLNSYRLYYFLIPRQNDSQLLGDKRGSIKLTDIEKISLRQKNKEYLIYIKISDSGSGVKKANKLKKTVALNQFANVYKITLKAEQKENAMLWAKTISDARITALERKQKRNGSELKRFESGTDLGLDDDSDESAPEAEKARSSTESTIDFDEDVEIYDPQDEGNFEILLKLIQQQLVNEKNYELSAEKNEYMFSFVLFFISYFCMVFLLADSFSDKRIIISFFPLFLSLNCFYLLYSKQLSVAKYYTNIINEQKNNLGRIIKSFEKEKECFPELEEEKKTKKKYIAGQTSNYGDYGTTKPMSYFEADASKFSLRVGPNYAKNKNKAPSKSAWYDVCGLEIIKSKGAIVDLANKFALPSIQSADNIEKMKELGLPRVLIFNFQVSYEAPTMFGNKCDDAGCSFVLYFRIKPEIVDEMFRLKQENSLTPAMKLWLEFVDTFEDPESRLKKRFKAIAMVENLDEFSVLSKLSSYNAKPFILNKVVNLRKLGANKEYLEMDVDTRRFGFIAKKLIHTFADQLMGLKIIFGCTIQAEVDQEMPENMVAVGKVHNVDIHKFAKELKDLQTVE
eukprot:maker-scaffold_23-snap-gene-5.0-mRNA-1 protein AED:0.19 eAED:0.19 QI:142/1/0.5/1/1/1/2/0/762